MRTKNGLWSYGLRALVFNLMLILGVAGPAVAEAAPKRILALGDSLTHGYGLPDGEIFPVQLENALAENGVEAEVINAGVSGDTSAGGLARLDWALGDPAAPPDLVIVELGANDALRALDPAATEANLDQILTRLDEKGIPALLTGMYAPPNLGPEYGAAFNAIYPRLAEKHQVPFYPFFLDGVAAEPDLNQADGMHPNGAGVAIIADRIAPLVIDALQ
ncbi:arylesterase [Zavarzinia marina]|uniref:arylesterase n=1 Tax=Zavarzinia marina TaxID=2911065 RepID=UPI002E37FEDA|nr:arylesterase [Zavarzinia marina]